MSKSPSNESIYKISVFDFVKDISKEKKNIIKDNEKDYVPYIVNKALSYYLDTSLQANEMNMYSELDRKMQFDYLFNSIEPRYRYKPWLKNKNSEEIQILQEYFGYNYKNAAAAARILSPKDIKEIKAIIARGNEKDK